MSNEPVANIANPFVEYDTLSLAEEAAGFSFIVPENVEGYSERVIQLANGKLFQVMFLNGDDRLILRKERGIRDISGDYNRYPEIEDQVIGSKDVNLKGSSGRISCAVWQAGEYTYAVMCDTPMERDRMFTLIESIE